MSYVTIRQLLEVHLNSVVGALATAWENVPYKPTVNTPYQRVNLLPAGTENPVMDGAWAGSGLKREVGVLQVTLHYPLNAGTSAITTRAELLRTHFARGTILVSGGVRVVIDKTPDVARAMIDDGYFVLPVSVVYRADVVS